MPSSECIVREQSRGTGFDDLEVIVVVVVGSTRACEGTDVNLARAAV